MSANSSLDAVLSSQRSPSQRFSARRFSGLRPRLFASLVVLAIAALLVAACSGGSQYSGAETGEIAQRFLPTQSRVAHHPDSLSGFSIVEEENKLAFQTEETYTTLTQKWSVRPRDFSANRTPLRQLTYATLWSRELSLISLQPEAAVTSLSKPQAKKIIARREGEYKDFLQIDVYWFGPTRRSNLIVAGPGTTIRLETSKDSTYRPTRTDYGPIREAFVDGGRRALYRRNTFYFDRNRDGSDPLANTTSLTLSLRPSGTSSDFRFQWTWADETSAAPRPDALRSGR